MKLGVEFVLDLQYNGDAQVFRFTPSTHYVHDVAKRNTIA